VLLTNKPAASRLALVHVHDPRVRWGVRAAQVLRIASADEWLAAPAIDVLAAMGAAPRTGASTRRVMIVRGTGGVEIALVVAGPITIVEVDAAEILPLPTVLATTEPSISAIIAAADTTLSLLFDPVAIPVVLPVVLPVVIATSDAVLPEEPCPTRS
jgi:hypothetical protein